MRKMYVGNLPWSVDTQGLSQILEEQGLVFASVQVLVDRESGRSRGFGFVHFETDEDGAEAMAKLSGLVVQGRPLVANEANSTGGGRDRARGGQRPDRPRGGPGGFVPAGGRSRRRRDDDEHGWE